MNSNKPIATRGVLAACVYTALLISADLSRAAEKQQTHQAGGEAPVVVYKPPLRGAPATRVGAGTRGKGISGPVLYVLAPEHAGMTRQEQPTLFWFVSHPVARRIEFALIDDASLETLIELQLAAVQQPGIQQIALADLAVKLEAGKRYQWFVSVADQSGQHSNDIVASGMIERSAVQLAGKFATASEQGVRQLAGQGLWYDALQMVLELIETQPQNNRLQAMRSSLLEQVGLSEVAKIDSRTNPAR